MLQALAPKSETATPLVRVDKLSVQFGSANQPIKAVSDAALTVWPGEILGIAGESGSGKSTLCSALMRALPSAARVSGAVNYRGQDIYALPEPQMRRLRGSEIAMILQNPMTSLDPLFRIGDQIREVLDVRALPDAGPEAAIRALRRVHLTAPEERVGQYPHQLSGGMRQRVLTAMATLASPGLLLADEPTTALDATVQEEILLLFREIRDSFGTAVVLVTHDLNVIRRLCDRTVVMYAGRIVEDGPTGELFRAPRHPYTQALLASMPRVEGDKVVLEPIAGQVPSLASLPPGCPFSNRCAFADERCEAQWPAETAVTEDHRVFCWHQGGAA